MDLPVKHIDFPSFVVIKYRDISLKSGILFPWTSLFRARRHAHPRAHPFPNFRTRRNDAPQVRDPDPGMPDLAFFSRMMPYRRVGGIDLPRAPP